jgi:hypothetical protein
MLTRAENFYHLSNTMLLMLIKYTFENQESLLLGITFFSSPKFAT